MSGIDSVDRALVVREPWVGYIVSGEKVWELRSRPTKVRGRIGLIRSGSGLIVGTAELVDCLPMTEKLLSEGQSRHRVPPERLNEYGQKLWAWVLREAKPLPSPIPYRHPQGAVIWVRLDGSNIGK